MQDEKKHREYCFELLEIFDLARVCDEGGTSFRTDRNDDSRSCVRSQLVRSCCCSTSRPQG